MVGNRRCLRWSQSVSGVVFAFLVGCSATRDPVVTPPEPETPTSTVQQVAEPNKMYQLGEAFCDS